MGTNAAVSGGSFVSRDASEEVALEDVFAFIILLDPKLPTDTLTNVEKCRIFSTFDELRACAAGTGPSVQSKPVVILSSDAPPGPDHLRIAVAAHWKHGGKYVISRVRCRYLAKTGELELEPVADLEMHRLTLLPSVLSMPVSEALLPSSQLLLFVPSDEFTVCVAEAPPSEEELARLAAVYKRENQTPAELERLASTGALNHVVLGRLDVREHPTLANLITARVSDYRQLNTALRSRDFAVPAVERVISLMERSAEDLIYQPETSGAFLAALSKRSDILLKLRFSALESFIALSRQSCKADEIATNLALIANELCRSDPKLISPLFEFFANSLSPEALNATYCFAAAEFLEVEEHCIRLAQSMHRFGDETILALLLAHLYRAQPRWLGKRSLARCFQPLLTSPLLPALTSQVGEKAVASIQAWLSVADQFGSAVRAGDRALAKEILRRSDELAKIDFKRWLNGLRGLAYELHRMALPLSELNVPSMQDLTGRKLAAVVFGDRKSLESMRTAGELSTREDLNAVALNLMGDNRMLNDIIVGKFLNSPFSPLEVEGDTVIEVFRNAQKMLASQEKLDGPLVSVIMSAYNPDVELMEISLRSVAAQTWKNVETFIVDDASDSSSQAAIMKLASTYNHVKVIRVDENAGPYFGRNLALRQAKGEFIAIQDADDWSHPQRLAAQIDYLLHTPEARVVATEHMRINRAGHVSLEGQFRTFGHGPATSVFRAEIFDQIGGFAAIRSRGDLEMHERVAAYYGCQANALLPFPMALCFADSRTLSHQMAARRAEHLHLFRTNRSNRTAMNSLFRDGIPLRSAHQTPVPMMLRAPDESSRSKSG
jgi:hypothetical protein